MVESETWEFKKNDLILDIRLENPVPYLVLDSEYHSMYMLAPYVDWLPWKRGAMAWEKEEVERNFVLLDEQEGDDEEG